MIDSEGYRASVGIVVAQGNGDVLWAKRVQAGDSWQFPQGGIDEGESVTDAMFRELYEEVGLQQQQVTIVAQTRTWLRYRIPDHLVRKHPKNRCIGQKQRWFLVRLDCSPEKIRFDCGDKPEFSEWRWVSYWYPVNQVVAFKRTVYRRALRELSVPHTDMVSGVRSGGLAEC